MGITYKNEIKDYIVTKYLERCNEWDDLAQKWGTLIAEVCEEEKWALKFLFATLPYADLVNEPIAYFEKVVKNALFVRSEFQWCSELPDTVFLHYVLCPRVNTEEQAFCNEVFYEDLKNRVGNLSLESAILEANIWCSEHVTYQKSDDRTLSPLAVYRAGHGRCGEESAFAVMALRSIGIAARQVYAPSWSHCDDNHAWVEVFCNGVWQFFGACEPELTLNRGWFKAAASRAMLVHARSFAQGSLEEIGVIYPDVDLRQLRIHEGVVYENITHHYAKTKVVEFIVRDHSKPCKGAKLSLDVLNTAEFREVACFETQEDGAVLVELGRGSINIRIAWQGQVREVVINTEAAVKFYFDFSWPDVKFNYYYHFDMFAPRETSQNHKPLTEQEQEKSRALLQKVTKTRTGIHRSNPYLREGLSTIETGLVESLTDKDHLDLDISIMEDHVQSALNYEKDFSSEIFMNDLLCPRIYLEPLSSYRSALEAAFSKEQIAEFQKKPRDIYHWLHEEVKLLIETYSAVYTKPAMTFALKRGTKTDRDILFVALCRTFGIPAHLHPMDGVPEYYEGEKFRRVREKLEHRIRFLSKAQPQYHTNWAIGKLDEGGYKTLDLSDCNWSNGELSCFLAKGDYRLITMERLPNGNIFAKKYYFRVDGQFIGDIELTFRSVHLENLLQSNQLPLLYLNNQKNEPIKVSDLLKETPTSFIWLNIETEPSEHILNELLFQAKDNRLSNVILVLKQPTDLENLTVQKVLSELKISVFFDTDNEAEDKVARRMFLEPGVFPLVLLVDKTGAGIYADNGYRVGVVDLLRDLTRKIAK